MSEPARDRWVSIGLSVLLHGTVIGLLAYGWWSLRRPAPAPTLPIQATVVDARTLKGMGIASTPSPREVKPPPAQTQPPAPAPSPPPTPVPEPEGPPQPSPQELAMRAEAAKQEAAHQAAAEHELQVRQEARQKEEAQQHAEAEAAAAAQAKKLERERKLAQAKKRAEARKLAREKKRAEERKLALAKKLAEEKKLAAERAARERAQRIAQLQQSLNDEAQRAAAKGELASWQAEITSRIQNAWIRPPTARPGIECVLDVTEVPGGAVTNVTIGQCNGDQAVRESIEAAVYRASPLPAPPDPSLFQRELIIKFKPTD